ncbi:MAG: Hsp70 family protein [Archangium sp.]|nr:Hsp70 family protein [Archangium sp.]
MDGVREPGKKSLFLGIDLGTTNSAAAMFDGTQVHLVRNPQGTTLTPSIIRMDSKGNALVGNKARKMLDADPDNTRGEFKRLMGTSQLLEFPAAKKKLKPEELSAEVLKSLRTDVQDQFGVAPARAVISVPALFELPQASATSEAARLAGFERVELIQEPIASALAAGWTTENAAGSWMVYDLGGGTFDASLLETRDGLLRVIGHDGDNFLGGRDFDHVLVDHVLGKLSADTGLQLVRADPSLASGVRKLKLSVEDAKIELTRAQTANVLIPALKLGEHVLDVDVTLNRDDVNRLCLPLVDRSIGVCVRLLRTHGLEPSQLSRLVLVGGPTVMPVLRQRLKDLLGVSLADGLDPMTLVAQGAALYAASAALDARPAPKAEETGRRVWLQYPAMTSDLSPHVVGRLVEEPGPAPKSVQLQRHDGWKSAETQLNEEGAFVLAVDVQPRRPNEFTLIGKDAAGKPVALKPSKFSIVQGLTLTDPPLSRTIGVAMANDLVNIYFERGAPLPARRTFRHETVEAMVKGQRDHVLRIPIVQGEYEQAHLCRLVGALEIRGDQLNTTLPASSQVELTLELDRGGRLSARAMVVSSRQVFEEIAQLLVPDASPEALANGLKATRDRLATLRTSAFRLGLTRSIESLGNAEQTLAEVERDIEAARGGDADAAQKAKRGLLEIDAALEDLEAQSKFPELEEQAVSSVANWSKWVAQFASPQEQRLFDEAVAGVEKARRARQITELQRRMRQVRQLGLAAYYKHPDAWTWDFENAAADMSSMSDLPRAEKLVAEGRAALEKGDQSGVKRVTEQLWRLLPADAQTRKLGHDSSLR